MKRPEFYLTDLVKKSIGGVSPSLVIDAVDKCRDARVAEIRATKTDVKISGKCYYVSADGNDENDGTTPESAWKTPGRVSEAELAFGDGVFFRRGDLFRGFVTTKAGVTYSAYGEGEKPKIYVSPRGYSGGGFWKKTEKENVYVFFEEVEKDVGNIVFDDGKSWTVRKTFGIQDFDGVLRNDLEMHYNIDEKKVYLYSVSDPNTRFESFELCLGQNIFSGDGNDVTIDNICMKYTGSYGIAYDNGLCGGVKGLTVQNCEFGWIGGRIHIDNGGKRVTRAGNAVEIYCSCSDYTVNNCYIYQVFDAGITNQYWTAQKVPFPVNMENIRFSDNVIEYCTWNIEYNNAQPADNGGIINVEISGNMLLHAGEGWGNQRPVRSDASVQGWATVTNYSENFRIFDNVISTMDDKAKVMTVYAEKKEYLPEISGNIFIGKEGHPFGDFAAWEGKEVKPYGENLGKEISGLENNEFILAE